MELHVFSDASKEAIGHVMYIRAMYPNNNVHVSFVFGNSKVAPRSANTIPRLELCAAVKAAQSARYVVSKMEIAFTRIQFYCDSMIVLGYITNREKSFSKYVEARVGVILRHTSDDQWTYVSTDNNPADLATRPQSPVELKSSIWYSGPGFLSVGVEDSCMGVVEWPELPEIRSCSRALSTRTTAVNTILQHLAMTCSSWRSATRRLAYVIMFVARCRKQVGDWRTYLARSEGFIIREMQKQGYPQEYNVLCRGHPLPRTSPLLSLCPFMDSEQIMRVGGRLANAELPYAEKHPRLIPTNQRLTTLIASYCHERACHQGRHITAAYVRHLGFHLHKMRKTISDVLKNCVLCQKLRGVFETQRMADLPADRVEKVAPFSRTGVDVFGPYSVTDGRSTRRSAGTKKVWVVLFTCLYCRAVHLEPISSMDTTSFSLALRRFTAIRGECLFFRSDCGTNFVGTRRQMERIEVGEMVTQDSTDCRTEWKFLPPHASHFGGVWERKVGSIKRVFNASLALLGNRFLSREEFHTLIQEAARVVNNTPLGEISSDPNDPLPVCPAALLTLRDEPGVEREQFAEQDLLSYGRRRWRRIQYLADQFWIRWKRDYVSTLQSRRKWQRTGRNVRNGDVMLVRDSGPRNTWEMGIILDASQSGDRRVRSVLLKLNPLSDGKPRIFRRAIHDLVLLVPSD